MPRMDGTGPLGKGSMTGRGRGRCILPVGEVPVYQDGALGGQGGARSASGGQGGLRRIANAFCRFGGLGRGRGNGCPANGGLSNRGMGNGGGGFGRRGGGRGANGRNVGF
ncbi:hypothetical protein HM1_0832 [Heliomicrobium modesticaldum Ice1]|uniref:Uncharacterized protein n=1 Tax=Heliobacterium modesticaldum (strain ATCC 51547 / Ice1) TaxID=498761 RepID=B0TAS6_HELMI|nr:DUF5320 domain-containing protein [Heliomicrobium modesticaldum]ABZ83728.1 hypothetical protein HM1_0832 [Heliomicrobium modesticaldum Ice1]